MHPYQTTILSMVRAAIERKSNVQVAMVSGSGSSEIAMELAMSFGSIFEGVCVVTPLVRQHEWVRRVVYGPILDELKTLPAMW